MDEDEVGTLIALSGLSGREFARLVGVSEMTVNRWEKGESRPGEGPTRQMRLMRRIILEMGPEAWRAFTDELAICNNPVELYEKMLRMELVQHEAARG